MSIWGVVPAAGAGSRIQREGHLPLEPHSLPAPGTTPTPWIDETEAGRFLHVVARLAPGRTLQDADSELRVMARSIAGTYPGSHAGWSATVRPLRESLYGSARAGTFLLFAAAALVLGVACLNVANLTLTRNASRFREFTVRAALGAGRGRLFRQVILESLWIALGGAAAGAAACT